MPTFDTIRGTAARPGMLSEHRLRLLQKQKKLPGVFSGNRFLVNVDALEEQLNRESLANVKAEEGKS